MHQHKKRTSAGEGLALGLGCFSVGLGLWQLTSPGTLAKAVGMPDASEGAIRAMGARELGNGLAILAQPDNPTWLWTRVGGDAVDVSYLASGFASTRSDDGRIWMALAAVAGVTALDILCGAQLSRSDRRDGRGRRSSSSIHVERATTINKSVDEVYQFWKNFENFPKFMRHLESVETLGAGRSRWRAKGPAGLTVQWDAETVEDREGESISWRSLPGADVENSGTVRFKPAPGARGTEVRVHLHYSPPAGQLGRGIAWLFGEEPDQQIHQDLHRFKQLLETGEIPLSDGYGLKRAAQPADPQKVRNLAGVEL